MRVPITIAVAYAVTVPIINRINKNRGNKPWAISKTRPFFWFVVAHNVFLAVYSAWTFVGMVNGLRRSIQRPDAGTGLVGTVDSLCKINGVGGLGNAIAYNQTTSTWTTHNPAIHLAEDGRPDPTDLGRIWNECLAFYGWWFYLSKFYEVFDTIIILAKGKRSSTLQTYHHAGAMMCMWAGIRYMSPPIWLFVAWNSLIHAIMVSTTAAKNKNTSANFIQYSYYTVTAFNIRVPQAIKQSLTTMQIMQFIVGAPYAALHSFLSYDIPVRVPTVRETISTALSSASSAVAAVATDPTLADTIKKLLFRAAGEGGVADNLAPASAASPAPTPAGHHRHIIHKYKDQEVTYTTEYRDVPCLNTQGQTLAVWMNVLYLLPLTFLFGRFFVKSYITRTIGQGAKAKAKAIENSGKDAIKGVDRKLDEYLQPVKESEKKEADKKEASQEKKEQQRSDEQKKQELKKEQESKKEAEVKKKQEVKKEQDLKKEQEQKDAKKKENQKLVEQKQEEPKKEESKPAATEKSQSDLSEKSDDFEKIEHDEKSKPAQEQDSDNEDELAESVSTPNTPSKKKKNKKKKKKAAEGPLHEADAPPPITAANVTAGVTEMSFAEAVKEDL